MSGAGSSALLLEREDELGRLTGLVAAARSEQAAVAVVEGPPGIGKTQLLAALGGLAEEAGLAVLRARGAEFEQGFAFGVVRQLFEAPLAAVPGPDRQELLSGAAAPAAPLVDPEAAREQATQQADPFPLLHGLYWLAANLADRAPVAILVDDAHWADGPSLRWLAYLCRRLEGVAALVALAARSTEPEAPVPAAPDEAERARECDPVGQLARLGPAAELVHQAPASPEATPFCW